MAQCMTGPNPHGLLCVHYHNVVLRSEKRLMKASRPKSSHLSPFFHSWLHCFLWGTHNLKTDKSGLSLSLLHPLLVIICLGHKKDEIYFLQKLSTVAHIWPNFKHFVGTDWRFTARVLGFQITLSFSQTSQPQMGIKKLRN